MAYHAALTRILALRLPRQAVVDVGSGLGELSLPTARHVTPVPLLAIDRDPKARRQLAAMAHSAGCNNLTVQAFDANAPADSAEGQLPEGPFDLLLCTAMLQYVADDVGLLRRMAACASPDARLLLYVPVGYRRVLRGFDGWVERHFARQDYDRNAGLQRRYTAEQVMAILGASGWRPTTVRGVTGRLGRLHYELHTLLLYATRAWIWPLPLLALYLPVGMLLTRLDEAWMRARLGTEGNGVLVIAEKA